MLSIRYCICVIGTPFIIANKPIAVTITAAMVVNDLLPIKRLFLRKYIIDEIENNPQSAVII